MTNTTTDKFTAAYERGSLPYVLARAAEEVVEELTAEFEAWGADDWGDVEAAGEFHAHLRSIEVWSAGGDVHASSRLSENGAWAGTVAEVLDAASAKLPADLVERIEREFGSEMRIDTVVPGHDVLHLW